MNNAVDCGAQVSCDQKWASQPSPRCQRATQGAMCQLGQWLRLWAARLNLVLLLLFGGAGAGAAQQMNCHVFDDLTTLLHLSEHFLDDIEMGANTGAAKRLSNFLNNTSLVELRVRIVENGFEKISGPTAKFMALQETILRMRAIGGQFKAASAARKLRMRQKLEIYRKELVSLPCMDVHGIWRKAVDTPSQSLISTKAASIGAVLILVLGVVAFVVFDRIQRRISGRKKRFMCRAKCTIQTGGVEEPIEAQIVDISRIGAKIKTDASCPVGHEAELIFPKKKVELPEETLRYESWSFVARVVWRKGEYFGLEFKDVLAKERMKQLISIG